MDEYIEREAAIAAIMSETPDAHYPSWYADKIKSIPAADVEPVRHGQWIQYRKNLGECSGCGYVVSIRSKYCPNCGAKMDGEHKEE